MEYAQLSGVEIFKVGTHNGDTYTSQDIDDIIDSFNALDYQPALKLGHDSSPGAPAVGYVTKLWRKGDTLMAEFSDIPTKIFDAIKDKMFNRVSAEIWFNLERAGKKYRRALKALALLGAQVPAVAGLKPLADLFSDCSGEVKLFEVAFSTTGLASAARSAQGAPNNPRNHHGGKMPTLEELQTKFETLAASLDAEKKAREAAEAKLAELEAKQKGSNPDDDDLAKKTSKLSADQKAQAIIELNEKLDAAAAALKAEKEARLSAERNSKTLEARTKKLEEQSRSERVEKLSEQCVIPALRPFIRAFADLATREEDVRVYNEDGKQESAVDSVERLIGFCNNNSQRIFTVVSREDKVRRVEGGYDASDELDKRIKKYQAQNPKTDYVTARDFILEQDPVLKAEYAAASA